MKTIRGLAPVSKGKGATIKVRLGEDGITICDPNRARVGAEKLFETIYDRVIGTGALAGSASSLREFPRRISLENIDENATHTAMKEVFRNADSALVALYQSVIEAAGIRTFVHNSCTQQALLGGLAAAFFPVPEFFPRLSVLYDEEFPEAMGILRSLRDDTPGDVSEARCPHCGESVPGNFTACWKCENEMFP